MCQSIQVYEEEEKEEEQEEEEEEQVSLTMKPKMLNRRFFKDVLKIPVPDEAVFWQRSRSICYIRDCFNDHINSGENIKMINGEPQVVKQLVWEGYEKCYVY